MGSFPEDRPDWSNLSVLHRNTLPPWANFKIFNSENEALSRDETKARVQSLAGTWKFHLANSPFEAPEGFEVADFDKSQWSDIPVPSMWQLQGFGKGPVYTNVAFPIYVDPPHAPFDDNECGSYVTSFTVPKQLEDDQLRLRFEGVDSAYHVWVNGKQVIEEVQFSYVQHLTASRSATPKDLATRPSSTSPSTSSVAKRTCSPFGFTSSAMRPTSKTRTSGE